MVTVPCPGHVVAAAVGGSGALQKRKKRTGRSNESEIPPEWDVEILLGAGDSVCVVPSTLGVSHRYNVGTPAVVPYGKGKTGCWSTEWKAAARTRMVRENCAQHCPRFGSCRPSGAPIAYRAKAPRAEELA